MKEIQTSKGTFIVVPTNEKAHSFTNDLSSHQIDFIIEEGGLRWGDCILLRDYWNMNLELIGLVSDILKDEERACKVCELEIESGQHRGYKNHNSERFYYAYATDSFQSLCTKYELKDTDLLIRKL